MFGGGLARGDRRNVHTDKFAHIPGQCTGGAGAGFFGDGKQRVAVHGQRFTAVDHVFYGGEHGRCAGLVVQVTGADKAVFGEFGQGIEGYKIPYADALGFGLGTAVGANIQP